jgi:hypothetical protein
VATAQLTQSKVEAYELGKLQLEFEGRAYDRWTTENQRDNCDFSYLKRGEQSEYWNWRHDHPDDDSAYQLDRDEHSEAHGSG